jgi:hypothetical protein
MKGRVTEDGLLLASGRRLPWSDVYYVDWTERGARLATAAGVVDVSRDDGEAAERVIAPWEAEREAWAREVDVQRRLDWAGVTSGTEAVSRQGWGAKVLPGCFGLFAALPFVLALLLGSPGILLGCLPLSILFAIAATFCWRGMVGPPITRDAEGLTVGERHIDWSDLRAVEGRTVRLQRQRDASYIQLLTRRGRVTVGLHYQDAAAMLAGLRRAAAERDLAVPGGESRSIFAPSMLRPGAGLLLDDDGLVIVESRRARRFPWSQLRPPVYRTAGLRLPVGGKQLWLGRYLGGDALGHAIDVHLGGDEPLVDDNGELRATVIERWLGVSPGGALRCRLSPWASWGCGALLVAFVAVLVSDVMEGHGWMQSIYTMGMLTMMLLAMLRSARSVDADAKGLSVRRGRRCEYYAWSEIKGLKRNSYEWVITTSRGDLTLSDAAKGHYKVIGIVQRLLAMRETGAALPATAPTPESALSLARMSGPEVTDRGLSVSHDE